MNEITQARCSWTDESETLCTACYFEDRALERAGNGILHIVEQMDHDGTLPAIDLAMRARICGSLVAAYIAGASEENDIWRAADKTPNGLDTQPRNIDHDIRMRAPAGENPPGKTPSGRAPFVIKTFTGMHRPKR